MANPMSKIKTGLMYAPNTFLYLEIKSISAIQMRSKIILGVLFNINLVNVEIIALPFSLARRDYDHALSQCVLAGKQC